MTASLYIRPVGRIAPPAGEGEQEQAPAIAAAWRDDLRFAGAEVIERDGASIRRRLLGAVELLDSSAEPRLQALVQRLSQPRIPIAGLALDRPRLMGVINVTPDSFSDGGRYRTTDAAVEHALRLEAEGADILDIGGESTRPGADPVHLEEECRRVLPVIAALAKRSRARLSVDTRKAEVMRRAAAARRAHHQRRLGADARSPQPGVRPGSSVCP